MKQNIMKSQKKLVLLFALGLMKSSNAIHLQQNIQMTSQLNELAYNQRLNDFK
jgi:hypothetical protein